MSHDEINAIACSIYEWLKNRRAKGEISTLEALMKVRGYKWGSKELKELEEMDLFEIHSELLRMVNKDKEYMMDFSAYEGQFVGLPYDIPFVFRKLHSDVLQKKK